MQSTAQPTEEEISATIDRWLAREREVRLLLAQPGKIPADAIGSGSGIEFLQRLERGELPSPPICHALDFVPVEFERGLAVFQGTPKSDYYNPIGCVHGGYVATLLDSAVGCAVQSTLAPGFCYTTIELKLNFVRPVTDRTGPVRAEGRVIHVSRQIGTAEGRLVDAAGKLYAHATTTCLIFPVPPVAEGSIK